MRCYKNPDWKLSDTGNEKAIKEAWVDGHGNVTLAAAVWSLCGGWKRFCHWFGCDKELREKVETWPLDKHLTPKETP